MIRVCSPRALLSIHESLIVAVIPDEELYRAVDNVYAVLGDDAPYTEDEVIAALERFDMNEEKAISHLLGTQSSTGIPQS